MGYFRRQLTATRTPPARTSGADAGGVTEGVCRGRIAHVVVTAMATFVVCATEKNAALKDGGCIG